MTIRTYALLTKPGIIMGNLLTTASGFALASKGAFDFSLFLITLIGLGSVIASACVINNYIDRFADEKMERTKDRALVQKKITPFNALSFAAALGTFGFLILLQFTNLLAAGMALLGFFVYVVLYSFCKYHSLYGTLIGSVAGAVPPVVGYCAAGDQFDGGALLLLAILVFWQMPHFYSIAIYHYDDYFAASIPVLPIEKGILTAKVHMVFYIIAFVMTTLLLFLYGYAGQLYLLIASLMGLAWLALCVKGLIQKVEDKVWGKQMFVLSLAVVSLLCVGMVL